MDVLPSIPNIEQDPNGILLGDTDLRNWQKSNPIDYSDWFYESMKVQVLEFRESMAKALSLSVEEVPDWQVKTPLQRAIQLLKRHRDVRFYGDPENKPVSIILTTLGARAYRGERDVYEALSRLASDMPNHVERRGDRWWVENPVEPDENFADKWNEKPERWDAFIQWLRDVQRDVSAAAGARDLNESAHLLKSQLGATEVDAARARLFRDGLALASFSGHPVLPDVVEAEHSQQPSWPMRLEYRASIKATLHYAKATRRISELAMRRVAKNLWIRFELVTDTPRPYGVFWKVVNTGAAAKAAGQLRGPNFSETGNVRGEHTGYVGTHWMEADVVKDGRCVAEAPRRSVLVR
jgi:hypothetical protein